VIVGYRKLTKGVPKAREKGAESPSKVPVNAKAVLPTGTPVRGSPDPVGTVSTPAAQRTRTRWAATGNVQPAWLVTPFDSKFVREFTRPLV
jgi:hypothetical protein